MTDVPPDVKAAREVLARYPEGDERGLIHALQDLQAALNYVPVAGVKEICAHLGVSLAKAFSVATFYRAFSLSPKGEVVQVLVDELVSELNVKPGGTTEDLKFTLETVNCVGACAMAPVISVNGKYHGKVKPGRVMKAIR
jgi:NADH-quinone oxidoreductase subunit E